AGHEAAVFFEDHAVLSASVFLLDLRKSDRREERFEIAFVSIGHRYFAASLAHQQQVVEPSPVVFWNGIDLFPEPRRAFFLRLHLRGFLRGCGRNVDIHRRRFDGFRGHSWQCFSPRSIHCVRATQAHYIARERKNCNICGRFTWKCTEPLHAKRSGTSWKWALSRVFSSVYGGVQRPAWTANGPSPPDATSPATKEGAMVNLE